MHRTVYQVQQQYVDTLIGSTFCTIRMARNVFLITVVQSNQDLIWCVKIGRQIVFWVHRGF